MSERLTDAELDDIAARVLDGKCHVCAGTGAERPFLKCFTCEGTGVFALSTETMLSVLTELRSRRAIDLTAEEVEALGWARAEVCGDNAEFVPAKYKAAVSILDRLIGAKP